MIESLILVLWLALCYVFGYLLGMLFAEWINKNFREEFFSHV